MSGLWIAVAAVAGLGVGISVMTWRRRTEAAARQVLDQRSAALYALAEGDRDNVAHDLEHIAEAQPGDATVFLALAALDRERGRVDRAKAIHRTVLAQADLSTELRVAAFVGLGRDLLAQGQQEAAVGALSRAISLAPQSLATLETLARALEQAGAWDRAAAAWERHEKLVPARRRRDSRIRRGHAVAGQATAALADGELRKAQRLAERALELAPDSGHVWTVQARVAVRVGDPSAANVAWQRAWELCPTAAGSLVAEALESAAEVGGRDDLRERMLASLASHEDPAAVVALAHAVLSSHPDAAVAALQRVRGRSPTAVLVLVRLALAQDATVPPHLAALMDLPPPIIVCRQCASEMPRFRFHCRNCGAWDSATTLESWRPPETRP